MLNFIESPQLDIDDLHFGLKGAKLGESGASCNTFT